MKSLLLALAFMTSTAVFANDPSVFTGKYTVLAGPSCDLEVGARTYVTLSKIKRGQIIQLQTFSDEASINMVELNPGKDQCMGTSRDIHGKCDETTTVKWTSSKSVQVSKTINMPSRNLNYSTKHTLSLNGNKLVLKFMGSSGEVSICEFARK